MSNANFDTKAREEILSRLHSFLQDPSPVRDKHIDDLLRSCFLLIQFTAQSANKHWFCEQAALAVPEASAFLLRLHAYSSPAVPWWKQECARVIHSCCSCNWKYQDTKIASQTTYLATYSEETRVQFIATVDQWEKDLILMATPATSSGTSANMLDDTSFAVIYHILSNPALLQDANLLSRLTAAPLPSSIDVPRVTPSSLLVLALDAHLDVQLWAIESLKRFEFPSTVEPRSMLGVTLASIMQRLIVASDLQATITNLLPSTLRTDDKWSPFVALLGQLSPDSARTILSIAADANLTQVILDHIISRTDVSFAGIIQCFSLLLKFEGQRLWNGKDTGYPTQVFTAIKENPHLMHFLARPENSTGLLGWIPLFIQSVWSLESFSDVLAGAYTFLGEDLVNSSLDRKMVDRALYLLFKMMSQLYRKANDPSRQSPLHVTALRAICERHPRIITSVAFARTSFSTNDPTPSTSAAGSAGPDARSSARALLERIFSWDADATIRCVKDLALLREEWLDLEKTWSQEKEKGKEIQRTAQALSIPSPLQIHFQLWRSAYSNVERSDADGVALLIAAVAKTAYLEPLKSNRDDAFSSGFLPSPSTKDPKANNPRTSFAQSVESVNKALSGMREGFNPLVVYFAEHTSPSQLHSFLCRPLLAQHTLHLLLCPIDLLNDSAKSLALNAYDASERSASYKAFFEKHPESSFIGVTTYLQAFNEHIRVLPDACGASKYLVRSLTEILNVLCDSASGLLNEPGYGALRVGLDDDASRGSEEGTEKRGNEDQVDLAVWLPKLWKLMTSALATIFRRVKVWAPFYANDDMVAWMRDALIFGRDCVAEVEVMTAAAVSALSLTQASTKVFPIRDSSNGTVDLISDLKPVFRDLLDWLRLTDQETLYQAHRLLISLLTFFQTASITPSPDDVSSLLLLTELKHNGRPRTQLDSDKLAELLNATRPFVDEKTLARVKEQSKPKQKEKEKEKEKAKRKAKLREVSSDGDDDLEYIGSTKSQGSLKIENGKLVRSSTSFVQTKSRPTSSSVGSTNSSKKKASAATSRSYKPVDRPSDEAIANYRKLQARDDLPVPKFPTPISIPIPASAPKPQVLSSPNSSDANSEDDEDSEDGKDPMEGLRTKEPPAPKLQVKRQMKYYDPIGNKPPVRMSDTERARQESLRLRPDLTQFHQTILQWNYEHDGPEPPGLAQHLQSVPDSFPGKEPMDTYRRVFQPLIHLETWSQLIRSKEEKPPRFTITVKSRRNRDNWLDLEVSLTDVVPDSWYLAETDVVLLKQVDGAKRILGKAAGPSKRTPSGLSATISCSALGTTFSSVDQSLLPNSYWELSKVLSLSTVHREYAALMSLPYYDLFHDIVQPTRIQLPRVSQTQMQEAMERYGVNEPQARAIVASFETEGFSLIQGPPGTGKTSTILGLVGAFLSSRPRAATHIHAGRNSTNKDQEIPKKVLICAPSNAAIDEVAHRLMQGVRDASGKTTRPRIVRIGASEAINAAVKEISLDELIAVRLSQDATMQKSSPMADISGMRAALGALGEKLRAKRDERSTAGEDPARAAALDAEISTLSNQRRKMGKELDDAKDQNTSNTRVREGTIRMLRVEILKEADIVCTTLSGSGHESLSSFNFETVIIDEAAQSIELSSLIPLKYRCIRCILVGGEFTSTYHEAAFLTLAFGLDPKQLAPTVLSPRATKCLYNQSLFVRIQKHRPDSVHLLSIQYRMHPEISVLPSKLFYDSRLEDGEGMAAKRIQPWHRRQPFMPYQFFDVVDGVEQDGRGHSQMNQAEISVAIALYSRLRNEFSNTLDLDRRIGVVTMYRAQMLELRNQFSARFGRDIVKLIDFNTVDGFQGQEKDIIILSCVRAGPSITSVGFLADTRRMNVAFTRARCSLFILGHAATLERSDPIWAQVVQDARSRSHLVKMKLLNGELPAFAQGAPLPPSYDPSKPTSISKSPAEQRTTSVSNTLTANVEEHVASGSSNSSAYTSESTSSVRKPATIVEPDPSIAVAPNPKPPQPRRKKNPAANLFIKPTNKRPPPPNGGPSKRPKFS